MAGFDAGTVGLAKGAPAAAPLGCPVTGALLAGGFDATWVVGDPPDPNAPWPAATAATIPTHSTAAEAPITERRAASETATRVRGRYTTRPLL